MCYNIVERANTYTNVQEEVDHNEEKLRMREHYSASYSSLVGGVVTPSTLLSSLSSSLPSSSV
jgi:hypothetical protein